MSRWRKIIVSTCAVCLAAGSLVGGTGPAPKTAPPDAKDEGPSPQTLGPITYFNDKCANCHGNYGSFWGEGFAAELSDEALREVVEEMAAGPAQAPLNEAAVEVQTAYHRSLVDGKPFIVAWREGETWKGEVTPEAKIRGDSQEAEVEGHTWSLSGEQSELVVTKGEATTKISLDPKAQKHGVWYSHRKPPTTQPTTGPEK